MSNRLSSTVSVSSVSSYATIKASNRDIKVQRQMESITDSEQACFAAMWLCINKHQRKALTSPLDTLGRPDTEQQERNDTLSFIDHVLHVPSQTNSETETVDTFVTLLRDLAAPGLRAMLVLAQKGCLIIDSDGNLSDVSVHTADSAPAGLSYHDNNSRMDSAGTLSDVSERMVDIAPAALRSHESGTPTILPAEKPGCSSAVTTNSEN